MMAPTHPEFEGTAEVDVDLDLELIVGTSLEPVADRLPATVVDPGGRESFRLSGAAEVCIARFAADEADVARADLHGLGRVSAVRYPRLGGVLHGRVGPGTRAAGLVVVGAEQTIRAGYHAALATHQVGDEPVLLDDATALWDAFLPASYRIPRTVAAIAWDVCRFDEFWVHLLGDLGLDGDAKRFGNGHVSPLSRSIRGLSTVGVALALTERGGRHDRRATGMRRPASQRREGRALPPAPRVLDDRG
jgi:hypothetical protein